MSRYERKEGSVCAVINGDSFGIAGITVEIDAGRLGMRDSVGGTGLERALAARAGSRGGQAGGTDGHGAKHQGNLSRLVLTADGSATLLADQAENNVAWRDRVRNGPEEVAPDRPLDRDGNPPAAGEFLSLNKPSRGFSPVQGLGCRGWRQPPAAQEHHVEVLREKPILAPAVHQAAVPRVENRRDHAAAAPRLPGSEHHHVISRRRTFMKNGLLKDGSGIFGPECGPGAQTLIGFDADGEFRMLGELLEQFTGLDFGAFGEGAGQAEEDFGFSLGQFHPGGRQGPR